MDDPTLRALIIQDDASRDASARATLQLLDHQVVALVRAPVMLCDVANEHQPDVVILQLDQLSCETMVQVSAMTRLAPRPVVVLAKRDDPLRIADAVSAGMNAYHVGPYDPEQLNALILLARAQHTQRQQICQQLEQARSALSERKLVERAKGILMDQRGLGEAEAYRRLRTLAMNRKRRIAEVARDIIEMAELLKDESRT